MSGVAPQNTKKTTHTAVTVLVGQPVSVIRARNAAVKKTTKGVARWRFGNNFLKSLLALSSGLLPLKETFYCFPWAGLAFFVYGSTGVKLFHSSQPLHDVRAELATKHQLNTQIIDRCGLRQVS